MTQEKHHRRATGGHMVLTPAGAEPYKAVLTYEDGRTAERPFRSLREGEAFLRDAGSMIWPPEPLRTTPQAPHSPAE